MHHQPAVRELHGAADGDEEPQPVVDAEPALVGEAGDAAGPRRTAAPGTAGRRREMPLSSSGSDRRVAQPRQDALLASETCARLGAGDRGRSSLIATRCS